MSKNRRKQLHRFQSTCSIHLASAGGARRLITAWALSYLSLCWVREECQLPNMLFIFEHHVTWLKCLIPGLLLPLTQYHFLITELVLHLTQFNRIYNIWSFLSKVFLYSLPTFSINIECSLQISRQTVFLFLTGQRPKLPTQSVHREMVTNCPVSQKIWFQ